MDISGCGTRNGVRLAAVSSTMATSHKAEREELQVSIIPVTIHHFSKHKQKNLMGKGNAERDTMFPFYERKKYLEQTGR